VEVHLTNIYSREPERRRSALVIILRQSRIGPLERQLAAEYLAFVGAAHDQVRLLVHGNLNALGNFELHGVRLSEGEGDRLAFQLRAIADSDDVQFLFEALRDAVHGVSDQRASQSM